MNLDDIKIVSTIFGSSEPALISGIFFYSPGEVQVLCVSDSDREVQEATLHHLECYGQEADDGTVQVTAAKNASELLTSRAIEFLCLKANADSTEYAEFIKCSQMV